MPDFIRFLSLVCAVAWDNIGDDHATWEAEAVSAERAFAKRDVALDQYCAEWHTILQARYYPTPTDTNF